MKRTQRILQARGVSHHPEAKMSLVKMQRTDGDSVEKLEANTEESLVKYYGRDRVALPGNQADNRENKYRPKVRTW